MFASTMGEHLEQQDSLWAKTAAMGGLAALTVAASAGGARVTMKRKNKAWYRALRKPPQTPPDQLFGIVWPALYTLNAYSGYRAWRNRRDPRSKFALALWGTQLAANAAWSPLFFGKHRARAALGVLALNFVSLAAYAWRAGRVDRAAGWLMAPYLAWLGFASTLNAGIIRKNPRALVG